MRLQLQRHFFVTVPFAFLFATALSGQAAHAGFPNLTDSKRAVVAEINLIEEIFGEEALQTEVNRDYLQQKLHSLEQILLAHAGSTSLQTSESTGLPAWVPIAIAVCDKTMPTCYLAGKNE